MRKFYSSLLIAMGICSVATAQFTGITGPTNQGGVGVLPGTGAVGTTFTLTQATNHFGQAKGVWANAAVNLSSPFSVCANLNFGSFNESNNADPLADWVGSTVDRQRTGADGIAFVMSKAVASGGQGAYVGETGEEMGYGTSFYAGGPAPDGFTPRDAMVVEFDTWQNDGSTHGARNLGDPVADHMAFMRRGSADHGNSNGINNGVTPIIPLPELETGLPFPVKISWNPATGLTVDFNNGTIMNATAADVLAALGSPGNPNIGVNWGFNSGTGQAANLQTVQIVECQGPPPVCTLTVDATLPALSCDGPNVIYLGYGPQSVTATSNQAGTTFQWFKVGTPDVLVSTGATFSPTESGTYYVVGTNGACTASTKGTAAEITVIDIRCGNNKVYICHKKNGTQGNGTIGDEAHTICVSTSAIPAHLAQGCCLGQCPNGNRSAAPIDYVDEGHDNAPIPQQATIGVFPNPSRGQVQVNLSLTNPKAQIYIINSKGTIVERRPAGNLKSFNFNLKQYGTGVYLVKIVSGGSEQITKVVVQE